MELRKLIAFGKSTFSITLPKPWVTRHQLSKGDMLAIEELPSGELQIASHSSRPGADRQITIAAESKSLDWLQREIIAAYIKDYTHITLTGIARGKLEEVKRILHELIALEVVEVTANKLVAKTFVDTENVSLEQTLRRIYYILKTSSDELASLIRDGSGSAQAIRERDVEVNRQTFYLIKLVVRLLRQPGFARQLNMTSINAVFIWHIAECLEKIADRIKDVARIFSEQQVDAALGPKGREELLMLHQQIFTNVDRAIQAYFNPERAQIEQIFISSAELRQELPRFARAYKLRGVYVIGGFYRDILLLVRSIAERRIDME